MRLAVNVGYVAGASADDHVTLAVEADRLGYDVCWAAEAYGSDAPTLLAFVAARTERIDVGSAVMQIPARSPAMTAMTAATLDLLSHGRFRLGLGVSGPQVSEGWHGVRFAKPLSRTREYVDVVRMALARETVAYEGEHHRLPLPDSAGKALKLMVAPARRIPLYLAAVGPRNLALCGEVADGWLGIFFAPEHAAVSLEPLAEGARRAGRDVADIDVTASVPVVVGPDPRACADALRGYTALYVGGMGSREQNFYNALARRMGYDEAAQRIQDLYLDRRQREAMAAVPFDLVDQTALLGPPERIAERMGAYAQAGVTTLAITPVGDTLQQRVSTLRVAVDAWASSGVPANGRTGE